MQPIHLSYTPDRTDFAAVYALERTPAALRMVFFGCVLAMSGGLDWLAAHDALLAALIAWSPPWGEVATVALMVLVMYGVLIGLRNLSRGIRAGRAAATAVPVDFAAAADGITVTESGRFNVYPWSDVRAAWLGRNHVFLSVAGRRLALPRRAFADDATMNAFAVAAEERMRTESEREEATLAAQAAPETAR